MGSNLQYLYSIKSSSDSFKQFYILFLSYIVSNAVKNLKVPVTAKIRVFEDIDKTVEYAKMIEKSGISVLLISIITLNLTI